MFPIFSYSLYFGEGVLFPFSLCLLSSMLLFLNVSLSVFLGQVQWFCQSWKCRYFGIIFLCWLDFKMLHLENADYYLLCICFFIFTLADALCRFLLMQGFLVCSIVVLILQTLCRVVHSDFDMGGIRYPWGGIHTWFSQQSYMLY